MSFSNGHSNDGQGDGDEFVFDPEQHEVIELDDALEILEQENGDDIHMDSDEGDDDTEGVHRPQRIVKDTSIAHFAAHSSSDKGTCSVFCLATHPIESCLAVSGGEDDLAYLFRMDSGEEVAKLTGHTDSVVCCGFSSDGELVATGGMDGRTRLWRRVPNRSQTGGAWEYARWEFLTNLEGPDEVTCMAWHPKGPVLAVGANDGTVWLFNLPSGKLMGIFSGHSAAITDLKWASPTDGKRLVSASADSEMFVWDPKDPSQPPVFKFTQSDGRFALPEGIACVAINPTGALALVGGASAGALKLVNIALGQFIASFGDMKQGHARSESSSIEAVAFVTFGGPMGGVWLSAGGDGAICAWEANNYNLRWKVEHTNPDQNSEGSANVSSEGAAPSISSIAQQSSLVNASSSMDTDEPQGDDQTVDEAKDKTSISNLVLHPTSSNTSLQQTPLFTTATAEGIVQTWEVKTGKLVSTHEGHASAVHALGIGANANYVASAGDDGLVRIHALHSP